MPHHRLRRCLLAVPGASPKMMAKAAALAVDQVMLDLEDAVAPSAKPGARGAVADALLTHAWPGKIVSVRVNAVATPWFRQDVEDVVGAAGAKIDTIILPKVESAAEVLELAAAVETAERAAHIERRIGIEPQIESARGLCFVEQIAFAHERIESLTFGPADFAASIGSPALTIGGHRFPYPGHVWHYALSRIVVAAKAAGLDAMDGPYGDLKDEGGLRESAQMARVLGCDGKWAIHPGQIAPIVEIFTPSAAEIERAKTIAERYGRATRLGGTGAIAHEGELLDAASVRLAESTLRRHGDAPGGG